MLAVLLFFAGVDAAGVGENEADTIQRAAAQLYAGGEPALAATLYHDLVVRGIEDAGLYFNLGQSYLASGEDARAAWALYSAQRLAPRNQAIRRANQQLYERLLPEQSGGAEKRILIRALATSDPTVYIDSVCGQWLTPDEHAGLAIALWFSFGFCAMWLLRRTETGARERILRRVMIASGLLCLVVTLLMVCRIYVAQNHITAVVIDNSTAVYAGPGTLYAVQSTVVRGSIVRIRQTRGAWAGIQPFEEERPGWIRNEAIWTVTVE